MVSMYYPIHDGGRYIVYFLDSVNLQFLMMVFRHFEPKFETVPDSAWTRELVIRCSRVNHLVTTNHVNGVRGSGTQKKLRGISYVVGVSGGHLWTSRHPLSYCPVYVREQPSVEESENFVYGGKLVVCPKGICGGGF